MSLKERAVQAAELHADLERAERARHRAERKEADIATLRLWWNEHIGEPRADFHLPAKWTPGSTFRVGIVTCDGWVFEVAPRHRRESGLGTSEAAREIVGYVVTGEGSMTYPECHKGSRYENGAFRSLYRLGQLLAEIGEPPKLDINALVLSDG